MHYIHCVRRLLIQSRVFVRAVLLCALLLGGELGLTMYLASAQGTQVLSVDWAVSNPVPKVQPPVSPATPVPPAAPVPPVPPHAPLPVQPPVSPHVPSGGVPHVPPSGFPHVPPGGVPGVPGGGGSGGNFPGLPSTGSCPFTVISQC